MLAVGFSSGLISDPLRSNWDETDARPIWWSAWYPVPRQSAGLGAGISPPAGIFVSEPVCNVSAETGARRLPVVVFSHGTGGAVASMSWLAHRLARAGYLTIGIDHHGNTAREPYCAEGFLCWWERSRDLSVALDFHLSKGPFSRIADGDRIYAAGFSLGGYTVVCSLGAITELSRFHNWARDMPFGKGPREFPDLVNHIAALLERNRAFRLSYERQSASFRDDRIRAGFLCAPAPTVRAFEEESLQVIQRSVAITVGQADREAPVEECAAWLAKRLPNSELKLIGEQVGHYVFLDQCTALGQSLEPEICVDPPGIDRRHLHDEVAAHAVGFFNNQA
ncbi:hypothetical protein H6M51_12465 [Rhizobium sp. AQ_MP]|uniref:alpha/beta hydrolase family protein n=1 Tax=Rhizobium sp. AQ_MP TaxID=2761536 RepID=UPI00163A54B6|nr:hypothetical protein [Rhizobium sp. AQ_MP]MBC2773680.1 hypothetical protein [Rhizobium sp. AQ_MP]